MLAGAVGTGRASVHNMPAAATAIRAGSATTRPRRVSGLLGRHGPILLTDQPMSKERNFDNRMSPLASAHPSGHDFRAGAVGPWTARPKILAEYPVSTVSVLTHLPIIAPT